MHAHHFAHLTLLAGTAAVLTLAAPAQASDDHDHGTPAPITQTRGDVDLSTGRDLRNFPPSPYADFTHMTLRLSIKDMNTPVLRAVQELTLTPLGKPLRVLRLDAEAFEAVTSVRLVSGGHDLPCTYDYTSPNLRITPDEPLPPGQSVTVITTYILRDPPQGLYWTPRDPAWPNREAQLHSQGQPESNRFWFPCHDFPNDKLTSEIIATVPSGFLVISNGSPVPVAAQPPGAPYTTFHWRQDKPHVPYLVSLVIGKFEVVDLNPTDAATSNAGTLPMPVYVPPGRGQDVAATFAHTPDMIRTFGERLNEPYPWDRYAQLVVHNFVAGGMENTSASTLHDTALYAAADTDDHDLDGLIAHELAHQWFGDLLTCNSWEHIWLNEGFATFIETLWYETRDATGPNRYGDNPGRDSYLLSISGKFDAVLASDHGTAPATPGMAAKQYSEPWDVFRRAASPYPKGASILHMLRVKLGDDVFFKALALYIGRFKFKTVETADLRRTLEEVSGESLEQFFAQWVVRPGIPECRVNVTYSTAERALRIDLTQTQTIDADNPAFEFDLPIHIRTAIDAAPAIAILHVRGKDASLVVPMDLEPQIIEINPDLAVLAKLNISQPLATLTAQAAFPSTSVSRLRAIQALVADASPTAFERLRQIASDRTIHPRLRSEALGGFATPTRAPFALAFLASESGLREPSWDVRSTAINIIASTLSAPSADSSPQSSTEALRSDLLTSLNRIILQDTSAEVRCAALSALVKIQAPAAWEHVTHFATLDGPDDCFKAAALDAAVATPSPRALALAIELSKPGKISRTRAKAVDAISALASQNPVAAFEALQPLADDREARVRGNAWRALAGLNTPAARELLETTRSTRRAQADTRTLTTLLDTMTAKAPESP